MPQKFKHQSPFISPLHFLFLFSLLLSFSKVSASHLCQQLISALDAKDGPLLQNLIVQAEKAPAESCFVDLVPKYYWAQNMSHLMLKIQFLNSADTSACGRVLSTNRSVTHEQIQVKLLCRMGAMVLRYSLTLKTFMPLNYYQAVWKQGDQNTVYFQCLKSPSPFFWKRLYLDNHIPARKPRIWWKMMERYKEDMKNFMNDLEVEEDEEDISSFVRGKKKVRRTDLWEGYQPQSSTYLYCNQNNPFELWMI